MASLNNRAAVNTSACARIISLSQYELVRATSLSPTVHIYTVDTGQCSSWTLQRLISPWKLATDALQCKFPMYGELNYLSPISIYGETHILRPCQLQYILNYVMGFLRKREEEGGLRTIYGRTCHHFEKWARDLHFPVGLD